jgi:hypothetical protein
VIEETRAFHTRLKELINEAIDIGELKTDFSPNDISSQILRISRGVLFDWSIRNAPYKVHERALKDVNMFLNTMKS